MDAVVRLGQTQVLDITAHVPHTELLPLRVVPDAATVGARRRQAARAFAHLPRLIVCQHRVRRVIDWLVKPTRQVGLFDQEIVHEQLSSDVDRNDVRRLFEIRWLRQLRLSIRAFLKFDSVVESLTGERRDRRQENDGGNTDLDE